MGSTTRLPWRWATNWRSSYSACQKNSALTWCSNQGTSLRLRTQQQRQSNRRTHQWWPTIRREVSNNLTIGLSSATQNASPNSKDTKRWRHMWCNSQRYITSGSYCIVYLPHRKVALQHLIKTIQTAIIGSIMKTHPSARRARGQSGATTKHQSSTSFSSSHRKFHSTIHIKKID